MYIWALFLKEKKSLKDFPILWRLFNLALIINENLCCSQIIIFLALIIFASMKNTYCLLSVKLEKLR